MCEKKARVGGIRTFLVGSRPRVREEVKCFLPNLLLNFQAGALLGRVMGGNQRENDTFISRLFLQQQVRFKALQAM